MYVVIKRGLMICADSAVKLSFAAPWLVRASRPVWRKKKHRRKPCLLKEPVVLILIFKMKLTPCRASRRRIGTRRPPCDEGVSEGVSDGGETIDGAAAIRLMARARARERRRGRGRAKGKKAGARARAGERLEGGGEGEGR